MAIVPSLQSVHILNQDIPFQKLYVKSKENPQETLKNHFITIIYSSGHTYTFATDYSVSSFFDLPRHIQFNTFSSCVKLAYEVALQKIFFNPHPQLKDELFSKSLHALNVKQRRVEAKSFERFREFWSNHHEVFSADILGTLILGPTTTIALLSELIPEDGPTPQRLGMIFLRARISAKVIEQLNIDKQEKESWSQQLHDRLNLILAESQTLELGGEDQHFSIDKNKAFALSEFVASYLLQSEFPSLKGGKLKDVKCWGERDEAASYYVQQALKANKTNLRGYRVNVSHVISGTVAACLRQPEYVDQYFSKMFAYLDQKEHEINPILTPDTPLAQEVPPIQRNDPIFDFIIQYENNPDIVKIAKDRTLDAILQIRQLDFSCQQLSHEDLPQNLILLTRLESLQLTTNNLKEIPDFFRHMTSLKVLKLNGNQLTQIPEFIAHLPHLQRLDLLENPIKKVPSALKKAVRELPYLANWS